MYRILKAASRDPRNAWFAHRSVRVGAIFLGFYWCGAGAEISKFSDMVRSSNNWIWCEDPWSIIEPYYCREYRPDLPNKATYVHF